MQAIYQSRKRIKTTQNSTTQKQTVNLGYLPTDIFSVHMCIHVSYFMLLTSYYKCCPKQYTMLLNYRFACSFSMTLLYIPSVT